MKIDDTNKQIIKQLADGRKPYSAIAQELGITENTVRSRVNKLISDGVLRISGLVNPDTLPEVQYVFLLIKLNTLELEEKAKELSQLRGVTSAVIVTGQYDIVLQAVLNPSEGLTLSDFFRHELKKVDGLGQIETLWAYQSNNYFIPFIE